MKKRKKNKKRVFLNYISFCLVIISLIMLVLMYFLNILPIKYFVILCAVVLLIDYIVIKITHAKKPFIRFLGIILSVGMMVLMVFGISYEFHTLDFYKLLGKNNYNTENYIVYVLKTSKYEKVEDLKNKTVVTGTTGMKGLDKAKSSLKSVVNVKYATVDSYFDALDKVLDKTYEAVLIESAQVELIKEENEGLFDKLKVLYEFSVDVKLTNKNKELDISKNSFNLFISGIDTYGKITSVARSDVNLLLTVNPNTNKILVTSIPRDYYVSLHSKGKKDKLTHAGIYGIDESVLTIEDLLGININYYFKVNFTSLIDIVDTLGGIEVESQYSFKSKDGYYYKKGLNSMDGKHALSFARERKAFSDGDIQRGKNQQAVLAAIINKLMSSNFINKYNSILKSLDGKFITNLSENNISSFIKKQIDQNKEFTIMNNSVLGTGSYEYTYSYPKQKLYVMVPNDESLENAKQEIKNILEEK